MRAGEAPSGPVERCHVCGRGEHSTAVGHRFWAEADYQARFAPRPVVPGSREEWVARQYGA